MAVGKDEVEVEEIRSQYQQISFLSTSKHHKMIAVVKKRFQTMILMNLSELQVVSIVITSILMTLIPMMKSHMMSLREK